MLVIRVEWLHGILRAGSPDDVAITGDEDSGEWPPSPARLLSALVAGGGTRGRSEISDDSELAALEAAGAPVIRADAWPDVQVSEINDRYVVVNQRPDRPRKEAERAKIRAVPSYPGRRSSVVHPGPRLSPRHPAVFYEWPTLEMSERQLWALRYRAARVGYVGCADSAARVTVATSLPESAENLPEWAPVTDGTLDLPVPYPGYVDALDRAYDQFCAGVQVRRSWIPSVLQAYNDPGTLPEEDRPMPTVFWLRLGRPVSARRGLQLTTALRDAVLDGFGPDAPELLHGHTEQPPPYNQARFLALVDAATRHATGNIVGAAVWLPPGAPSEVASGVDAALRSVRELYNDHGLHVGLDRFDGSRRPWSANPARWTGPARRWVSVLPVVYERHTHGAPSLSDVSAWCQHAGVPEPSGFRWSIAPLVPGAAALRPGQVFRAGKQRWPYSHLEVWFDELVTGPVVLGRARQLGMGLMAPVVRDRESQ